MLTADGARRLRAVRDHIAKYPQTFDMRDVIGECGTVACFAGHLCWQAGISSSDASAGQAAELIGFSRLDIYANEGPIHELFFRWPDRVVNDKSRAAAWAIARLNSFLWEFGYPPDEIAIPAPAHDEATSTDAVDPQVRHTEVRSTRA